MRFLLDTHILLWLANDPDRLSRAMLGELATDTTEILFSAVNIWEIAIKRGKNRGDFMASPRVMLNWARRQGFSELAVTSEHVMAIMQLPRLHGDPFDRILIAQAMVEGAALLTKDQDVAAYGGAIRLV